MLMLCIPLNAKAAGWSGFPVASNQNWNVLRQTTNNTFSQLWYAAVERSQITDMNLADGNYASPPVCVTFNYVGSYTNEIVTVPSGAVTNVYTNIIPIYTHIVHTNDTYLYTQLVTTLSVTWTNEAGIATNGIATVPISPNNLSGSISPGNQFLSAPYLHLFE